MRALSLATVLLMTASASAQWAGFVNRSTELGTDRYPFTGPPGGNENYYDGDMGDIDGDGHPDRVLGSRFGLLFNTGGGWMEIARRDLGFLLRGDPGAGGWGEDGFALIDVDNDGDLDGLSGGNGEPLSLQVNEAWRFRTGWTMPRSALNISAIDVEGDGDADLVVAHAFCILGSCGGPVQFSLLINDGSGNMTEESVARGLNFSGQNVVGVVSGDLDGDGDYDMVIQRGRSGAPGLTVAINNGSGNFTRTEYDNWPTSASGFAQSGALGDVDGDGDLDLMVGRGPCDLGDSGGLVCGNYSGGHPVVAHLLALNNGSGVFTDVSATNFDAAGHTTQLVGSNVAMADVDHDGDLDFLSVMPNADWAGISNIHFSVFLNNGSGTFTYSTARSMTIPSSRNALGADLDLSDLNGDGSLDVWLGLGGDTVRILLNSDGDPNAPIDVPQSVRTISEVAAGNTIGWRHPSFASNVRRYEVYRSLAPRMEDRNRELIRYVGERHADQDFFYAINDNTTAAELGDADVTIAGDGEVRFTDDTAVPGVPYWYTIQHVGAEHEHSVHSTEVRAMVPGSGGADSRAPELSIVSPTASDWMRYPRIVIAYGDESGVDPSTLHVSLDAAMGPIAAGTNLVPMAYRHDENAFIAYFEPPHNLPDDTLVTLTARVSDTAGNEATATARFFVDILPALNSSTALPSAEFTMSGTGGDAPYVVDFDGSGSNDSDGQILRYEWYFGDGESALGRTVRHTFNLPGAHDVVLLVRDNEGGVATQSMTVIVTGMAPMDAGMGMDAGADTDAGMMSMDAGTDAGVCVPDCDGRSCGDDGCDGTCGTCGDGRVCGGGGSCLCEGGAVTCGDACVDLRTDEANCGTCENACTAGEMCFAGECTTDTVCTPDCTGRTCGSDGCDGVCGDCGADNVCVEGGVCECSGDAVSCDGACVDTRSNDAHCGACGNACGAGESCQTGVCAVIPDDDITGGCGCAVPGAPSNDAPIALLALGFVGLVLRRRR